MRIATIITTAGVGGAEVALLRLVEATAKDHEHLVVTLKSGCEIADLPGAGATVIEAGVGAHPAGVIGAAKALSALRRFRPDVLIGNMYHSCIAAAAVRPLLPGRPPMFWIIHHSVDDLADEKPSTRWAIQACGRLARAAAGITFVSGRAAEQHAKLGWPREHIGVIPNGYDPALFSFRPDDRARLRAEWGFGPEDIVVGHFARVHPMKDHANLLEALRLAHERDPRIAAVLCGRDQEHLQVPASLAGRVRLLGVRNDAPQVMSACDIGALSSAFGEAFPNVLVEFQCCERPCVTTDVGDAALIVADPDRVAPTRDAQALADRLLAVAAMPAEARARLGAAGRDRMVENYSIEKVAQTYVRLWSGQVPRAS